MNGDNGLERQVQPTTNKAYERILCAIEPDKESDLLLAIAGSLRGPNTQIHAVCVCGDGQDSECPANSSAYQSLCRNVQERARCLLGSECAEVHAVFGRPRRTILAVAAEVEADLIVLGTHAGSDATFLFGSTANHVLHFAECDVLAVRLRAQPEFKTISERYKQVVIALDMHHTDANRLMARGLRFTSREFVSLLNVLRLDDCVSEGRLAGGCVEEAYYRSEEQMRRLGRRFTIPQERQKLFVGSFGDALHTLVSSEGVGLFVLGNHQEGEALVMPVDALSAALRTTNSDVLVVR